MLYCNLVELVEHNMAQNNSKAAPAFPLDTSVPCSLLTQEGGGAGLVQWYHLGLRVGEVWQAMVGRRAEAAGPTPCLPQHPGSGAACC